MAIAKGSFDKWLDSRKSAAPLPHHDQTLHNEAHEHVRSALKAHFDGGGGNISTADANALLSDYIETRHGVQRGTIADPGMGYLTNRINGTHTGHEAQLANRRVTVDAIANGDPSVVARDRARDARLRKDNAPALERLHQLEADLHPIAGQSYDTLTPAQQAQHREYLAHPEAHPELQEQLRTGRTNGPQSPRALRQDWRRNKAIKSHGGEEVIMAGDVGHHYDGTFTHVRDGKVHVIQQGWDHEHVVSQAQQNLAQRNHAYMSPSKLEAERQRPVRTPSGSTDKIFHDGTHMSVAADGTHSMVREGWDAAHARSVIGEKMEGYVSPAPPPPPPPAPPKKTKAQIKAAAHVERLASGVSGASLDAAVEASHGSLARTHVNNALGWMESNAAQTHGRLRTKHVDAVVKTYAGQLAAGHTFGADSPHLVNLLTQEVNKPGIFKRGSEAAVQGASIAVHGTANGISTAAHGVASAAPHVGNAFAKGAKGGLKIATGAGKAVLVTGAAAAGLYALTQLLKSPSPPRRMPNVDADIGSEPLVFNPGANVGMGAMAVPQVGQQMGMGSWAPSAAMGQGAAPPGVVPTR